MRIERTGTITFLNIHDYRSDSTGTQWDGCLASREGDGGKETSRYTTSHRLQAALVLAYHTRAKVIASLGDPTHLPKMEGDSDAPQLPYPSDSSEGLLSLRA